MTRISRYVIDDKVTGSDKWIGSDSQTQYSTKNFTPTKLAVYFNENQIIDIGTPIRYKYDILEVGDSRLPGTITFEPQVGTPYSLSSISSFILSKYTLKGNDVTQYLNFLIGSNVLIYKADDINTFGLYKVVSLVENIDEPDFFDVVVSYTTGNGSILEDRDYLISLIDIPSGDIPTKTSDLINDGEDGVHPFITALDIDGLATVAYVDQQDFLKVDKEIGKGLSANDFTDVLKTKLDGIQDGAEVNVNADWNATSGDAFILNKPLIPTQGLTSVGLSMPVAFNVANSPLTSDGTLAVSAAGTSSQYIRGDGQLATLPTGAGGGSTVAYYLNGSINASVAGYKQLSNTATIGGGTDFTLTGNGLIAQFLTDLGNPNRNEIPGGAWNFEMYFQANSAGGNQKFYVELLKYNGTTFTSIASTILVPEEITGGTAIDLYLTSLAVPTTPLLVTDRLAIRVYIVDNSGGRTITLHTEDNTLCEIITTFSGGVTSLNGLTANTQYLAVGTTGTDFNISSLTDTHTFNLPTASATNRGALSSADWTTFNNKGTVNSVGALTLGTTGTDLSSTVANGTTTPVITLNVPTASATNRGALSTTDWTTFNGKFTLPSLTSGSVLFSNGTTIAQNNSSFNWDDTNYKLKIGPATNTLQGTLEISAGLIASRVKMEFVSDFVYQYARMGTTSNHILDILTNNIARIRVRPSGNVLIGTTTDNSGILQIKAPGALSTDIALRVRNSADTADLFQVQGNGAIVISSGASFYTLGNNLNFRSNLAGGSGFVLDAQSFNSLNNTNTEQGFGFFSGTFAPTSGTGTLNGLKITPTINQTGGANGITRGLFINPTLTSAPNFRAIETTVGNVILASTSGNVGIGTTAPTAKLHIAAPGALSTDIALRVRNSADTADLMTVNGLGFIANNTGIGYANTSRTILFNDANSGLSYQGFGGHRFLSFNGSVYQNMFTILGNTTTPRVGINTLTPNASAILDVESTTQGFLPPRMTTTQKNAIATPASGLVVYDTTLGKLCVRGASAWEIITSV